MPGSAAEKTAKYTGGLPMIGGSGIGLVLCISCRITMSEKRAMAMAAWNVFPRPTSSAMRTPKHLPGAGLSSKSMWTRACTAASWCQWRMMASISELLATSELSNSWGWSHSVKPPRMSVLVEDQRKASSEP